RHGVVARRARQRAHPRLFPGGKPTGRTRLALSRRTVRARNRAAALVPARVVCVSACSGKHVPVSKKMSAYAELAVTTNFSFLRGASPREELVECGQQLGLGGIGIADRNSVAGVVRAHTKAKEAGLRIVVGARLVFADGTPDILAYPQDRASWGRLTRLLTLGKRRAEKGDCILGLPDLLELIEGLNLIVLPRARIEATKRAAVLTRLAKTAAPHSIWLAGSLLYRGDDNRRLTRIAQIAADTRVPLIAVNDVLYHVPERRALQDVVT